jgi:lipopolysaccharide export system permease protein
VQDRQQGELGVVLASKAFQTVDEVTGERFIVLKNGARYVGVPGQADYAIARFEEYAIRAPSLDLADFSLRPNALPSALLWASDDLRARTELQVRLGAPLAVMVFAVLAVPLARSQPRKDIFGRIVMAVLVYFVFMNMQRVAEQWMEVGATPAWLGMWWVPLAMLGVAGIVILLDSHWLAARLRLHRFRGWP